MNNELMFSSESNERTTPKAFFDKYDIVFDLAAKPIDIDKVLQKE